jgi:acetylornithine deacetylase/succinyl-diaminopimelate desuccinylase-like protein
MRFRRMSLAVMLALTIAGTAQAQELRPDQVEFRALYKELVETDTSVATGSCTLAAEKMFVRLKAAGFADSQLTLFKLAEFPLDGGLVAVLPGTSTGLKPMLLLGHLDVVNAQIGRASCRERVS